jgi:PAS domain S-box-containing protein
MSLIEELSRSAGVDVVRLYQAVESLDQIFILVASDFSRVFYVNSAYECITGRSCESLRRNPRNWPESIYDEDRTYVLRMVAKRLSGELERRTELEFRIQRPDGEIRWIRSIVTPVLDETGEKNCLACLAVDITPQKQAELTLNEMQADLARKVEVRTEELMQTVHQLQLEIDQRAQTEAKLRQSETRFRGLFEGNIIGVLFSDIYGNIYEANRAFLEMSGYSQSDLPLRWDQMTPPEWSHASDMAVQQLIQDGSAPPFEKEYLRKDGTRVPALISATLLDRTTWQCAAFIVDLSERKNAEGRVREISLQLEHASRLSVMGEMLADLAHEIHQPLTVINNYVNGNLRRLKAGCLPVAELKASLREIDAESMRCADVLRRIRDFIRRREPERKSVDLNAVVLEALQFTRLERRQQRVAIILRPGRDLPRVQADAVRITQVLVNLVTNAVQALAAIHHESPKILISTYRNEAGLVEVSVADNGPGIAAADQPRIFNRFFSTKSTGLGLGLAISRSIIESHGGQLWYDSTPGEPALFRLTLHPAAADGNGMSSRSGESLPE